MKRTVGLDPGVHTGVATWTKESGFVNVATMSHVEAVQYVSGLVLDGLVAQVIFEDARRRTWFGGKGREALQGAGSIKRDCAIWAEWCALWGVPYRSVSPQSKGPKLSAEQFKRLTGWEGRTSEHARDAAMLCWRGKAGA